MIQWLGHILKLLRLNFKLLKSKFLHLLKSKQLIINIDESLQIFKMDEDINRKECMYQVKNYIK